MTNTVDVKVEMFLRKRQCDKGYCGGYMEATDQPLKLSNPPQIHHACEDCGNEAYYPEKYPHYIHREEES